MEISMRCRLVLMLLAALCAGKPKVAAADDELELAFNDHCRECHSFVKDDNRLGPTLYGIIGRKAGMQPGYGYTQSLKGSGLTWDAATLDKWIANPDAVIPGNGMSPPYGGVSDAQVRAKIIAFLKTLAPKPAAGTE
jgi:cytochrome c